MIVMHAVSNLLGDRARFLVTHIFILFAVALIDVRLGLCTAHAKSSWADVRVSAPLSLNESVPLLPGVRVDVRSARPKLCRKPHPQTQIYSSGIEGCGLRNGFNPSSGVVI